MIGKKINSLGNGDILLIRRVDCNTGSCESAIVRSAYQDMVDVKTVSEKHEYVPYCDILNVNGVAV